MSNILSSYQHCDKQQFQTLSCAFYTIFTIIKLDLFIYTSTVTRLHSCPEKKIRVRLACNLFLYRNQYFLTFLRQNIQQKILAYHSVLLGACPQHCSNRADTILYYIKKNILKCFKTKLYQNIYTKTHQIVPLFNNFL